MTNIVMSDMAEHDLEQIGDYICYELQNQQAALATVRQIKMSINRLIDFPFLGMSLASIAQCDTDYRFVVCGNYLAFYRTDGNTVLVDRVLYHRRDYISALFSRPQ